MKKIMATDDKEEQSSEGSQDNSVVQKQEIMQDDTAAEQSTESDQSVASEQSVSPKKAKDLETNSYQGHIAAYDSKNKTGILSTNKNNKSYYFELADWHEDNQPYGGCLVAFDAEEVHKKYGKVLKMELIGEYTGPQGEAVKSRRLAVFLSICLGGAGAGRFYLGFWKLGIAQVVATVGTLGFAVVWGVLEGILMLMHRIDRDAQNRPLK
ncbi:MAG: TM2 domain-containing protein [Methylococcales bacterium]